MLSYPIQEAEDLLESRLSTAKQSLANCEEDLDFLREQITVRSIGPLVSDADTYQTMEVATARVYNWDVVMRRKENNDSIEESDKKSSNG